MDSVSPFLDVVTRLWDCTANRAHYIRKLQENLDTLRDLKRQLEAVRKDVEDSAVVQEQQQHLARTRQVTVWLERVEFKLTEVDGFLQKGDAEVQQKCLGSCCPKHCRTSYKLGKDVVKMIGAVRELKSEGSFDVVVAENVPVPRPLIDEMPMEKIVGMESKFDEVWSCVEDNKAGIIGLYGMGGVGKTTLLKKLNNKFLETSHNFDVVIWVVVSKEVKLENIQQTIRNKLMIPDELWINRSQEERAAQIWERLRNKRFVLLLDDLWERLDLSKVGVSLSSNQEQFKVVFNTRSEKVCGQMEANMKFKLHGLSHEAALRLFREKVGEHVLKSHHEIPKLAVQIAKECNGLPLALVTIGRAMAYRTKPEEWRDAIEDLKSYRSGFSEMGEHVFPTLRFSYDNLEDDKVRTLFLYCSIFPKDHNLRDDELIELWIGEGFFDDSENLYEAQKSGRSIIASLKRACLLEESNDEDTAVPLGETNDHVKMHDVLYDMAHWLAREEGKEILVKEHAGLIKSQEIARWKKTVRVSLIGDSTQFFIETSPICSHLQTVFIMDSHLETLPGTLFQSMHTMHVLNLSCNRYLLELPVEIGALTSLRYLNLSKTSLRKLSIEVKNLTQLRILLLENVRHVLVIPPGVISSLSSLEMFSNFGCCGKYDDTRLVEELELLEKITNVSLTLSSVLGVNKFMSSSKLQSCIVQLLIFKCKKLHSLDITSSIMRRMEHLKTLHIIDCRSMKEVKICSENGERMKRSEFECFRNLQNISIKSSTIVNLAWLIHTPRIRVLEVSNCFSLEEIIASGGFGSSEIEEYDVDIFSNLEKIIFLILPKLKSICRRAMSFSSIRQISILSCKSLTKLPFSAESAKSLKRIDGERDWWEKLEWEDEATKHAFTSKFQAAIVWNPLQEDLTSSVCGIL